MIKNMFTFVYFILILLIFSSTSMPMSIVEATDTILDNDEKTVYLLGCGYDVVSSPLKQFRPCNSILKIDLSKDSKDKYFDGNHFARMTLSPDTKFIAVLYDHDTYKKQNELWIIEKDKNKKIIGFTDNIRKYRWSSDSKKIVYITGVIREDTGLHSDGVWVYDIEKKEKKKIAEKAQDVQWLPDGNIYIIDFYKKINKKEKRHDLITNSLIYNYDKDTIIKRDIKGINFSLDGKYSIVPNKHYYEVDSHEILVDIYDINSGKAILPDNKLNIFDNPIEIRWRSLFWAYNNRLIYLQNMVGKLGEEIFICDVENNKIIKMIEGRLVGTNSDRSKIVVYKNNRFEVVDIP